jgi:outer membrane protein OmpA-like peptidoglycan-associated protein
MCASARSTPGWGLWLLAALAFVRGRRRLARVTPTGAVARRSASTLLGLSLLLGAASAYAQHRDGTSAEFQANPFALDPAGRTLTTGSAEVMAHRSVRTAATYQWVFRPLVARDEFDRARLWSIVDKRHQLDLSMAVGLFNRWETSMQLPVLLAQTAQQPGWRMPEVGSSGVGDLVWSNKLQVVRLTHPRRAFGIAIEAPIQLPTHSREVWMGEPGLAATPTALVSGRLGRTELTLAGGVHVQRRITINNFVDDDSLRGAVAVRYEEARTDWALDVEFVVDHLLGTAPDDAPTRGDATMALRRAFGPVEFHMGVGTGMFSRAPGPAMRGFAGLAWLQDRRSDGDGDGIALRDDACEWLAEDHDGVDDHDGCPDPDVPAPDAPAAPVLVDGFTPLASPPTAWQALAITDTASEGADHTDAAEATPEPVEEPTTVQAAVPDPHAGHDHGLARLSDTAIEISEPIRFAFGTAVLAPESEAVLRDVLRLLVLHPEVAIRIEGHTDASGPAEVNLRLSEARAEAVRDWLAARGCCGGGGERLQAVGHGETLPVAANHTAEGRAQNRRVELRLARPSAATTETASRTP